LSNFIDHAGVKVHPPVLLLLHLILAFLLHRLFPLPLAFPNALTWIGYLLVLVGIGLAFSAVRRFMQAHTTLDPHGSVSMVVTNGPYNFSRNPIYLGFVCLLVGFSFIFKSWWGLILSPIMMIMLHQLVIRFEEAYLDKKFGEVYSGYKSRVRRWL
jgi:protein-S-isoprenylcysteine O-methyltransferase Ste14